MNNVVVRWSAGSTARKVCALSSSKRAVTWQPSYAHRNCPCSIWRITSFPCRGCLRNARTACCAREYGKRKVTVLLDLMAACLTAPFAMLSESSVYSHVGDGELSTPRDDSCAESVGE